MRKSRAIDRLTAARGGGRALPASRHAEIDAWILILTAARLLYTSPIKTVLSSSNPTVLSTPLRE